MEHQENIIRKRKIFDNRKIFYICAAVWPVLQFLVFYVYVNLNSILLSVKQLDYYGKTWKFVGFDNFKIVIDDFINLAYMRQTLVNTGVVFLVSIAMMFVPIILSFYLFKKYPLSRVFKVILFIPHIISSMALVLCYKFFVEEAIPEIWLLLFNEEIQGLLTNPNTEWITIIMYSVWVCMGGQFLLYLGSMSGISDSIFDAAKVDGVGPVKEFFYIVFPMIYPTFLTFVVTSFAVMFTNQMNVFTFYGDKAEYNVQTVGYLLYAKVRRAAISEYPYYSAMGIILTLIAVPLCFGVRRLLTKLGPKTV